MADEKAAQVADDAVEMDDQTESGEAGTAQDAVDGQRFDEAYVKSLRQEAASYRTKLRELERAEEERQRAQMSELDRLKADLAEAQEAQAQAVALANERLIRSAVVAEASQAGFADPGDAWRMLDHDGFTVNEHGEVEGVDKAIKALVKTKPYLLRKTQPSASINADQGRGNGKRVEDPQAVEARLRQRFRI